MNELHGDGILAGSAVDTSSGHMMIYATRDISGDSLDVVPVELRERVETEKVDYSLEELKELAVAVSKDPTMADVTANSIAVDVQTNGLHLILDRRETDRAPEIEATLERDLAVPIAIEFADRQPTDDNNCVSRIDCQALMRGGRECLLVKIAAKASIRSMPEATRRS